MAAFGQYYTGSPHVDLTGTQRLAPILPLSVCVHCVQHMTESELHFWMQVREHLNLQQTAQ
jgi:hypothetical protein